MIQPDLAYQKTRMQLLGYELAAFAALRSGVPNCYRDGNDNTAWGWILHALARRLGALDYLDQYFMISRDPSLLTPPDLVRQVVPLLPITRNYPNKTQSDQAFMSMVLQLLQAYEHGARLEALPLIITAFTGADPSTFSVTEMFTQIGQPGVDCSYRGTIRVEIPVGGIGYPSNLFTATPDLIQDLYTAMAAAKSAHIGLTLVGKYPGVEDFSGYLMGLSDSFQIKFASQDGAEPADLLIQAPFKGAGTTLSPGATLSLSYQWYRDGEVLADGSGVSGATTDTLALTSLVHATVAAPAHNYSVAVTDPVLGTAWSTAVTPIVLAATATLPWPKAPGTAPHAPTGTLRLAYQPMSRALHDGDPFVLQVVAAPIPDVTLALSYQWYRNGTAISGATSADLYRVADLATDMGGDGVTPATYYAEVTDTSHGSVWSWEVAPVVLPMGVPLPGGPLATPAAVAPTGHLAITQQPMASVVLEGEPVVLTVVAGDARRIGVLAPSLNSSWTIVRDNPPSHS